MLLKSRISHIEMHSDEWKSDRIGRLWTSSNAHKMLQKEGLGQTGMNHIILKAAECLSGVSTETELDTDAVRHGLVYEQANLREFSKVKGITFLVTQKLIYGEGKMSSSTPDGIIVRKESIDQLSYDCSTVETKAYQMLKHVKCALCETPTELQKADPEGFWQVIDQLNTCDCLNGFISYYHPDLPVNGGGLRIIEFRKVFLIPELKFLNERKRLAFQEFEKVKQKLIDIKN